MHRGWFHINIREDNSIERLVSKMLLMLSSVCINVCLV